MRTSMINKDNLLIDCFAGGGGASLGIEMALGRPVDIAINHDPTAIRMHEKNHPDTLHLTEDIIKVDLLKYVAGRHVSLMWASPDCTNHSRAKGGKPRQGNKRMLPWAVYLHAKKILPDVIIMENVIEIQQWGPLDDKGIPIRQLQGQEYQKFVAAMQSLGYRFDSRELVAADYGAPTKRNRWYAVLRRDGRPIVWPEPTHNRDGSNGLKKWVPVHTVLDLQTYGNSIFGRKKPLAEKTMVRIVKGLEKFVLQNPDPFIINVNHSGGFRGNPISDPLPTITGKNGFALVCPYLMKYYKTGTGQDLREPLHTITTSPGHFAQISVVMADVADLQKQGISEELAQKCSWVSQFLIEYYKTGIGQNLKEPLHTIVTKDRFALITVCGNDYAILDICLRMLTPEELKLAQGFARDYVIASDSTGRRLTVSDQVHLIGNSVVPIMARELVAANVGYLKEREWQPYIQDMAI